MAMDEGCRHLDEGRGGNREANQHRQARGEHFVG
jgi:hypothetical protein